MPSSQRPQKAAVVVADCRDSAVVTTEGTHVGREPADRLAEPWDGRGVLGQFRAEQRQVVEVEGIAMIGG